MDLDELAQGLRRAHCSNKERDHDCVGQCTITVKGVELDCKLCGSDSQPIVLQATWKREAQRAKAILAIAGLDFDCLAPLIQRAVIAEFVKQCCPGCGRQHSSRADYISCACDEWTWSSHRGWETAAASKRRLEALTARHKNGTDPP